jgi:hypothetical protein
MSMIWGHHQDFRGADKGEIQRVEQQQDIFTLERGKGNAAEGVVGQNRLGGEIGSLLGYEGGKAHGYGLLFRIENSITKLISANHGPVNGIKRILLVFLQIG